MPVLKEVGNMDEALVAQAKEAAEAVRDALDELKSAIRGEVEDKLHYGGGGMPYELRNLLPDLHGSEGGWLMQRGDSFYECIDSLIDWLENIEELTDEQIVSRLEQEVDGEEYLVEINEGAPAQEVWTAFKEDQVASARR